MQIKVDAGILKEQKNRQIFDALYKNELSSFIEKTFRENIFNTKAFISNKQQEKEILYISVNISSLIVKSFADFCFGGGVEIEINNKRTEEEVKKILDDNYFDEILYGAFINQSKNGYTILRARKQQDNIIIEEIPYNYYYTNTNIPLGGRPTEHIIASSYKVNDEEKWIIDVYKQNENGTWTYTGGEGTFDGENFNIDKINIEETLELLPLVIINNQKIAGEIFGRSDLAELLDLLEELNDRITQISIQFIKHLNAKIALPESMLQFIEMKKAEGVINGIQELDTLGFSQGEQKPEYIENKNMLIKDAMDYIQHILRLISSIGQIPASFMGIEEKGGAEKVEALRIRMMRFLKKVERKQRMMEKGLKQFIKVLAYLSGNQYKDIEINFNWKEALPQTIKDKSETYSNLYLNGLLSKKTAISKIMDWDESFTEAEIARIKEEDVLENLTKTNNTTNNLLTNL